MMDSIRVLALLSIGLLLLAGCTKKDPPAAEADQGLEQVAAEPMGAVEDDVDDDTREATAEQDEPGTDDEEGAEPAEVEADEGDDPEDLAEAEGDEADDPGDDAPEAEGDEYE